jgi:hypothetical protein
MIYRSDFCTKELTETLISPSLGVRIPIKMHNNFCVNKQMLHLYEEKAVVIVTVLNSSPTVCAKEISYASNLEV